MQEMTFDEIDEVSGASIYTVFKTIGSFCRDVVDFCTVTDEELVWMT